MKEMMEFSPVESSQPQIFMEKKKSKDILAKCLLHGTHTSNMFESHNDSLMVNVILK